MLNILTSSAIILRIALYPKFLQAARLYESKNWLLKLRVAKFIARNSGRDCIYFIMPNARQTLEN
jgi:hypothetical protein